MKRKRKERTSDLHSINSDDRISRMPDDILQVILCSLTIKEATITSLLSRRWRHLCASLPRLDLDDSVLPEMLTIENNPKQRSEFVKRVRKLLRAYKGHSLEKFRLRLHLNQQNARFIDFCVKFALSKNVHKLELDFILSSGGQATGRLYTFRVGEGPSSSSSPGFKSLKRLCFRSVAMGGDVLDGLLSNCPVLEIVRLHFVSRLAYVRAVGPSLKLKRLEMINCDELHEIEIRDVVSIVSVKRLFCGHAARIKMDNVPNLVDLAMSITRLKPVLEFPLFSSCLSRLESLELSFCYKRVNTPGHDVLRLVSKLTNLKVLVITCDSEIVENLPLMTSLLEAPPRLHKISIWVLPGMWMEGRRGGSRRMGEGRVGAFEHLKVLEFMGYHGGIREDELISYVAKNAAALETIIVDSQDQSFPPPEYVRGHAKDWLGGIIPPTVKLVIQ